MKVKLALAGAGILLLLIAAYGWYLYNKPHAGIANVEASVRISAANLYNEFQQDEAKANLKYLNKVIEVAGVVTDVQRLNNTQIVLLSSNNDMGGVSCKISSDNKENILPKKSVIIKGKCSGYTMDVNLVDCIIK